MRVLSLNANGLRAAARKGFYDWLPAQNADFVCLQEIKAHPEQLDALDLTPAGYHPLYEPGTRKGHSGVAVFTRDKPDEVIHGFGSAEFDPEGRYLEVRLGNLSIASVYVPSGSSSETTSWPRGWAVSMRKEPGGKVSRRFSATGVAMTLTLPSNCSASNSASRSRYISTSSSRASTIASTSMPCASSRSATWPQAGGIQ